MTDKEHIIININKYFKKAANDSGQPITFILNCADLYEAITQLNKEFIKKTQEYQKLADILRATDTYSEVCSSCKDDILIYPSISRRTNYTDNEVDAITLRRIIDELKDKTQEGEKYKKLVADFKDVNKQLGYKYLTIKQECEELKKTLYEYEKYGGIIDEGREWAALATSYCKALEEIKEAIATYSSKHQYSIANDLYNEILDIINNVKE